MNLAVIDPAATAVSIANSAGGVLVDTLTGVVPVVIPVLAAFWGVRFALRKVGLGKAG